MTYKKIIVSISFCAIWLLAGCAVHGQKSEPPSTPKFSISVSHVKLQDTIPIQLPNKHPSKLTIRDPEGVWHLIHDSSEKVLLVDSADFEKLTAIELDVSEITGISWINGERTEGSVFNKPGVYLIYFADNLETEPENTFSLSGQVVFEP